MIQQSEYVVHEAGAFAVDPRSHACLTQILTGETRNKDICIERKSVQFRYVRMAVHIGKMPGQYRSRWLGDFAQQHQS